MWKLIGVVMALLISVGVVGAQQRFKRHEPKEQQIATPNRAGRLFFDGQQFQSASPVINSPQH